MAAMRRVSVVGAPGSGKTTFAARLAVRLGAPHIELDAIFHQPNWGELPTDEFRARVSAATEGGDAWVVDGNYAAVQDLVWAAADTVVWLDLHRRTVMTRLVGRTAPRVIRRERLWNDNRERWTNLFSLDPERSVLAWSRTMHPTYRARYAAAMDDPAWAHLDFVRLTSRRNVETF
jgi:adenylate kinase family enzyme